MEILFSEKNTWSSIFELPFKFTQETKLRWLQFQILRSIGPTNKYQFKLNILNSSLCLFCKNYIETLVKHVKELLFYIDKWKLNKFNISVCVEKISIVSGKYTKRNIYRLQNLLILAVKQYIFAFKYKQTTAPCLYFDCLKKMIMDGFYIDKYLQLKDCKYNNHERH